jgi:Flp pilus assembly pilin Flp
MLNLYVRTACWLGARIDRLAGAVATGGVAGGGVASREEGQTTAEYALVILAAAAVAIVLIAWARSSGKLPAFFDKIIDNITNSAQ